MAVSPRSPSGPCLPLAPGPESERGPPGGTRLHDEIQGARSTDREGGDGDDTIRVYLPGIREITFAAAEAEAFFPRFNQFTKFEDMAAELPETGSEAADNGGALEEERMDHHLPKSGG